jgi:Lanthionine-containing peptide SapB precursor RamS
MTHILELQSLTSDTYEEIEAANSSLSLARCTGSSTLSLLLCRNCCEGLRGTADAEFAQHGWR